MKPCLVTETLRGAVLVASLSCAIGAAHAHAPLARDVQLAPDGDGVAVRLPGFGLLVRTDEQRFAYACDALLGLQPDEEQAPLVYLADGSLLIGTRGGLRHVSPSGCPVAGTPTGIIGLPIVELVTHASDRERVYAVTGEPLPALYRSADGGSSWEPRAQLTSGHAVTALQLDPADPEIVYVTATTGTQTSSLARSTDGGATFETFAVDRDLVLLQVQAASASTPAQLWARSLDASVRGVTILRGERAEGPWTEVLQVNFFGGFAIDGSGAIWVGDEGGSVFRSSDGGDSFADAHPALATACLVHGGAALWACTPGLTTQRGLATLGDGQSDFVDGLALADVDRLIDCAPELAVDEICAAAWNEWRADVQGSAPDAGAPGAADAGDVRDAGGTADAADESDAGEISAPQRPAARSSTCAVSATHGGRAPSGRVAVAAIALAFVLFPRSAWRRRKSALASPA